MAAFARAWREVKITDEICHGCHYPIVEAHGWLNRKTEGVDKKGKRTIVLDITPDVCCYCHCPRQSLHTRQSDDRSWPERSVKV